MERPSDREETRRTAEAAGDSFVDGQADMLAVLERESRSAVSSLCHHYEFIGKDSRGWFTTVFSLTSPEFFRMEEQRRRAAKKASGKKSVDGRPRDERGRLLKSVHGTLVPDIDD